jgi:hypothetical protein
MRLSVSPADLAFLFAFAAAVAFAAILRKTGGLLLALAAALGCAAYAVFVDAHTDEVTATLLVIVGGTFLLGAALPASPWRWAAIVGLAIPMKSLASAAAKGAAFDWRILITLAFALAGAYAGAGVRRVVGQALSPANSSQM